jgi:hypothetical protein
VRLKIFEMTDTQEQLFTKHRTFLESNRENIDRVCNE